MLASIGAAGAASYSGTNYGSGGDNSNACPAGYSFMTSTECDAVANMITTANNADAKHTELKALLQAACGGTYAFGTTAMGETTANAVAAGTEPKACHMDCDASASGAGATEATNGKMYFNTDGTGAAKADKVQTCRANVCTCTNGVGTTGEIHAHARLLAPSLLSSPSHLSSSPLWARQAPRAPPTPPPSARRVTPDTCSWAQRATHRLLLLRPRRRRPPRRPPPRPRPSRPARRPVPSGIQAGAQTLDYSSRSAPCSLACHIPQ